MIYLFEILLVIINVFMAWYHATLIEAHRPILHGVWGGAYLFILGMLSIKFGWLFTFCGLLNRKVFFDLSLNLFRGLPIFYVSSSTTSILDKLHNKIFGTDSRIYMTIYLVILIALQFFL